MAANKHITIKNLGIADTNVLGVIIPAGGAQEYEELALDTIRIDDDVFSKIEQGELIVNDGIGDLSPESAVYYVKYDYQLSLQDSSNSSVSSVDSIQYAQGLILAQSGSSSTTGEVSAPIAQNLKYVFVSGDDLLGDGSLVKPYSSIKRALDDITDNDFLNRYSIILGPGRFSEVSTLLFGDYVSLNSIATETTSLIDFVGVDENDVNDLIVATGDTTITNVALRHNNGGECLRKNGQTSLTLNNVSIEFCAGGIVVEEGIVYADNITIRRNQVLRPIVLNGGKMILHNYVTNPEAVNIGVSLQINKSATCELYSSSLINEDVAAGVVVNGGTLTMFDTSVLGANNSIIVENGGIAKLNGVLNADTNDIFVRDTGIVILNGVSLSERKINIPRAFSDIYGTAFNTDSNTLYNLGDQSFGSPTDNSVVFAGQGKDYVIGFDVITTDNTTSTTTDGDNLTVIARDVLASDTDSTFTFQGLTAGHSIIFGSDLGSGFTKTWGLMINLFESATPVDTATEGDVFGFEIWDGTEWVGIDTMAFDPVTLNKYNNLAFERDFADTQAIDLGLTDESPWERKIIIDSNNFWVRIRILRDLSVAPVFSRFTNIPSSGLITRNGGLVNFGVGKSRKSEILNAGNFHSTDGVDTSMALGNYVDFVGNTGANNINRFENVWPSCVMQQSGDAVYFQFKLPHGISTAYPVQIGIDYKVISSSSATAEVILDAAVTEVGNIYEARSSQAMPVARGDNVTVSYGATEHFQIAAALDTTSGRVTRKLFREYLGVIPVSDKYEGDVVTGKITYGADVASVAITSIIIEYVELTSGRHLEAQHTDLYSLQIAPL